MKILLIAPPWVDIYGKFKDAVKGSKTPPTGLLYLAAYLREKSDHEIEIIDAEAEELSYERIREKIVMFGPDIVGVSAGFDGHHSDALLQLRYSMNLYHEIGKILSSEFKDIFAVLEGGYSVEVLPKCVHNFIAGINGEEIKHKEQITFSGASVKAKHLKRMEKLKDNLSGYWKF